LTLSDQVGYVDGCGGCDSSGSGAAQESFSERQSRIDALYVAHQRGEPGALELTALIAGQFELTNCTRINVFSGAGKEILIVVDLVRRKFNLVADVGRKIRIPAFKAAIHASTVVNYEIPNLNELRTAVEPLFLVKQCKSEFIVQV
jgi:hypothetical protein